MVNDELHELIKSMSRSEKRYFTLDANKSGGDRKNNYVKIFTALNDMEDYDEEKLKKKFRKEKFIKHLATEKNYLYTAILKSMRNFHSDKSAYARIKEMMLDAHLLNGRGLYEQGAKMLKKAKKLAYEYQNNLMILEINKEERYVTLELKNKTSKEQIEELINEGEIVRSIVEEEFDYLNLNNQLYIEIVHQFSLLDEQSKNELKDQIGEKLEKNDLDSISFLTQHRLYQSRALYFQLIGETEEVFQHFSKVLDLWDDNPKIKEEEFYKYIIDLSNHIYSCLAKEKYQYALPFIQRLETESPSNNHDGNVVFYLSSLFRLIYHMSIGEFNQAKKLIPKIEKGLKNHKLNEKSITILFSNIAILDFMTEDYSACLQWLNQIISKSKLENRQDIQRLSRILKLISYLEIEEFEKFENFSRTTLYFLKSRKQTFEESFEMKVLSFLKKLYALPFAERKPIYTDSFKQLENIKNNPNGSTPLGLEELYFWVKSKIIRKSMVELIKEDRSEMIP